MSTTSLLSYESTHQRKLRLLEGSFIASFMLIAILLLLAPAKKAEAIVNLNPNPVTWIPSSQYTYLQYCNEAWDNPQLFSPAFVNWLSLRGNGLVTSINVPYGTNSVDLDLNFAGATCFYSPGSVVGTKSFILGQSASNGATVSPFNPGAMYLGFGSGSPVGTYRQTGAWATLNLPRGLAPGGHDFWVTTTGVKINWFPGAPNFRCVGPAYRTPGSIDDWSACAPEPATVPIHINVGPATIVRGRVFNVNNPSQGYKDLTIYVCNGPPDAFNTTKTDINGNFAIAVGNQIGYCVRILSSAPLGTSGGPFVRPWDFRYGDGAFVSDPLPIGSGFAPNCASYTSLPPPPNYCSGVGTYEWQAAGLNCFQNYANCGPGHPYGPNNHFLHMDRNTDQGFDFVYRITPPPKPADFSCSVSPIKVEIGTPVTISFGVNNNSPPAGATISQALGNKMYLKVKGPLPATTIIYQGDDVNYGDPPPGPSPVAPGRTGIHEQNITLSSPGIYNVEINITGLGIIRGGCTITAVNKPYVSFFNGDVIAGGSFDGGTGITPSQILAFINPNFSGSASQLASLALGPINGYSSSVLRTAGPIPADSLKLSNKNAVKGNFGGTHFAPDYYAARGTPPLSPGGIVDAFGTAGSTTPYMLNGNVLSGQVGQGKRIVVYVAGDLTIPHNITYQNTGSWATVGDIPSLYVIVQGNIYIDSSVTQLDGVYEAVPNNKAATGPLDNAGNKGRIYTCTNGGSNFVPSSLYGPCNSQLVVNGAFIAQQVKFQRTANSLRDAVTGPSEYTGPHGAEVFRFTPETYIAAPELPTSGTSGSGVYQAITNLPPVL